jgi:hypothetical protein
MTESKSAMEMNADEYKVARKLASEGKLPLRAAGQPAAAAPPPAADPPPPAPSSTSSAAAPPTANEIGKSRGALGMTESEYRVARAAAIRQADHGQMSRSDYGLGVR